MSNYNSLALVESTIRSKVTGLELVKSDKTGNAKLGLTSKRDFLKVWKADPANANKSNNDGKRAYQAYRSATLKDLSLQTGMLMIAGQIQVERLHGNKLGDLRNIALSPRERMETDKMSEALALAAKITNTPIEEMFAKAKAAQQLPANATLDAVTHEIVVPPETETAAPAQGEQPAQPATETQTPAEAPKGPESVAAA